MPINTPNTAMRSIAAPDMMAAMRLFVSNVPHPNLHQYVLSIDHSPSEQVDGSEWHTSALIVSQNMEHDALANELGKLINPNDNSLKQWKNSSKEYKQLFHQKFFHVLKDHPVLVVIVTSKEESILSYEQYFAHELGISECYKPVMQGEKKKLEFGPYVNGRSTQPKTLIVSDKHAPMAIFTANHLLRIHTFLKAAICERLDVPEFPLWISVWSDKPPNDFDGPYSELMRLLLGGGNAQGKFTWGGFTGDYDSAIDLLADNLAGLFNEITKHPNRNVYKGAELSPPVTGVVYFERLE